MCGGVGLTRNHAHGDDLLKGGAGADELYGGYDFDFASYQGGSPAGVTVTHQFYPFIASH